MQRLVETGQAYGLPFVQLLRPGQKREDITQKLQSVNLRIPNELIEFYEFCDGIDAYGHTGSEVSIYYGYWFLPLQKAVDIITHFRQENYEEIEKSWFPLLKSGRDYFFVDCDRAERQEPYIVDFIAESESGIMYQSIQAMIDTFADCYQEGAIVVTDGEITDHKDDKEDEIAFRHNPRVKFWQSRYRRS